MDRTARARVAEFINAAVQDQMKARRLALAEPDLLRAPYLHGETALHFLAVEGHDEAVRLLAELGSDVNAVNAFGDTALVDVATLGNAEMARVLIECGGDPNSRSDARGNVLHAAVGSGNLELVRVLLAAGARADYMTELGETVWDAMRPKRAEQMERVLTDFGVERGRPTRR